jgi:hypothetical protein
VAVTAPTARAAKRDLIASLLDEIPDLSGRVSRGRVWPIALPDTPSALVYGWHEVKTRRSFSAGTQIFTVVCTFAVDVRTDCSTGEAAELASEMLAGLIEEKLMTAPTLIGPQGVCERLNRVETQIKADASGETVISSISMGFELEWTEVHQVTPIDLPPPYLDAAVIPTIVTE